MQTELMQLPLDKVQPGTYQPRVDFNQQGLEELAQSILSQGLIEPLIVRPIGQQRYEIIAGERRWRAALLAGLTTISCLVGQYSDKQACALGLIENIQRQDLSVLEEASAYRRLLDEFHYHQDEVAILVGKSRSHIANVVRLLTLTPEIKELIRLDLLSLGHARLLVGLERKQQAFLAQKAVDKLWSVRQLENAIKALRKNSPQPLALRSNKETERMQEILAEQVGTPVNITYDSNQGGWLQLKFFDHETFLGLLERLGIILEE